MFFDFTSKLFISKNKLTIHMLLYEGNNDNRIYFIQICLYSLFGWLKALMFSLTTEKKNSL